MRKQGGRRYRRIERKINTMTRRLAACSLFFLVLAPITTPAYPPPPVMPASLPISADKPLIAPLLTLEQKIQLRAQDAGVDPVAALRIARCESHLDPLASNLMSSAKGLYQFTDGTWKWIGAQGTQFDEDENILQFMVWYPKHPEWWVCK